jgi:hypothetical protein
MERPKDYIIKDSSMYVDANAHRLQSVKNSSVKVGIVRDTISLDDQDIAYIVEVWLGTRYTPVQCVRSCRFGGIYNYEEFTYRGFTPGDSSAADGYLDYKAGDVVVIAYIDGDSRDGVILGSFNHPGRTRNFDSEDGIQYASEFNGIEKTINEDGEYKVTFKGTPTNIDLLRQPVTGDSLPDPEYRDSAGSYYSFYEDGSYEVADNNEQFIYIDKEGEQIIIGSGNTSLVIDKNKESYSITNKSTSFNSADEFKVKTKTTDFNSSKLFQVKTKDIKTTGKWNQKGDVTISGKTTNNGDVAINGKLTTTGATSLAGGANPLIYDIVLAKGTGNKGAPVISSITILKTTQTKAT